MLTEEVTMNQLKFAMQALSLEPEEQFASFPEFVVVTDELLLEFDNWRNAATANYPSYFSEEQLKALNDIDTLLDKYEIDNPNMSIAEELKTSSFWKELRILAKAALVEFNWTSELPPDNWATYIKV
jgi:hypothetical protein